MQIKAKILNFFLIVILLGLFPLTTSATERRWLNGAESGSVLEFQGVLGTTPIYDQTIVRTGDYSLKIDSPATQRLPYIGITTGIFVEDATIYIQFWLYVDSAPSLESKIGIVEDDGNVNVVDLYLTTDRHIRINSDQPSDFNETSTNALTEDAWHYIEIKVVLSDTVGIIEAKIDGDVELTGSGLDTLALGSTYFDGVYFGNATAHAGETGVWYIDDIVIDRDGYPGGTSVEMLLPNGAGTGDALDAGAYTDCDEVPISDADYASYTTSDAVGISFAMQPTSATDITGDIYSVMALGRRNRGTGPGTDHYIRERDNSTNYDTSFALATGFVSKFVEARDLRPGGGSFTTTVLDSYEVGFSKGSGSQDSSASWIGLMVEFKESAEPVAPTVELNTADETAFGVDTTPTLEFTGTDGNGDDIRYNIQIDTANTFDTGDLLDKVSGTDSGFAGDPDNTDPFTSGQLVSFTVQVGDALVTDTYYWKVRGIDPNGGNTYGDWTISRWFTIDTSVPEAVYHMIIIFD